MGVAFAGEHLVAVDSDPPRLFFSPYTLASKTGTSLVWEEILLPEGIRPESIAPESIVLNADRVWILDARGKLLNVDLSNGRVNILRLPVGNYTMAKLYAPAPAIRSRSPDDFVGLIIVKSNGRVLVFVP